MKYIPIAIPFFFYLVYQKLELFYDLYHFDKRQFDYCKSSNPTELAYKLHNRKQKRNFTVTKKKNDEKHDGVDVFRCAGLSGKKNLR